MFDVAILTESRYVNPLVVNDYIQNVLNEDNLVKIALKKLGFKVKRLSWDDPNFDWSKTKFVLFRSTWDYFDRFDEFSQWLKSVSKKTKLINSEQIIRWNLDKHYLHDLNKKGISTIPTVYIEKGSKITLNEIMQKQNWENTILKPCVSGGARHTYKLNATNLEQHEEIFQKLILSETMMLQPFQQDIVNTGEISMVVINGKYTHAVLKKAKKGDFRVQDDWGGTVHIYHPTKEEILFV